MNAVINGNHTLNMVRYKRSKRKKTGFKGVCTSVLGNKEEEGR